MTMRAARKQTAPSPGNAEALRKRFPTAHELVYDNYNFFIRLESAAVFARPEVEALIAAAIMRSKTPLQTTGRGKLTIRSVSAKQRPRRRTAK